MALSAVSASPFLDATHEWFWEAGEENTEGQGH